MVKGQSVIEGCEMGGHLTWVKETVANELDAPFVVERDADYYDDLRRRYRLFSDRCVGAGADDESLKIVSQFSARVLKALRLYYDGKIAMAYRVIRNLVKECCGSSLAVAPLRSSGAFPGPKDVEIQFFRARRGDPVGFSAHDMLHLPYSKRGKMGNYRFSIAGVPSLYLGNSSYACWIELGRPPDYDFNVSPVLLSGGQRIFNLAVMNRDFHLLREFDSDAVHAWLRLFMLMVATSYRVHEEHRTFKSEYIISQGVMLACRELGLDGVAYYSKRVENQLFAQAAINLVLFANYRRGAEYGDICNHLKIAKSFNYFIFRQLKGNAEWEDYDLRCARTGLSNRIGMFDRQYPYGTTDFCSFDKFLFSGWQSDAVDWGNALNE